VKLSESSLVCRSLHIAPSKWPMLSFGLLFAKVPRLQTQWPLLAKAAITTLLPVTPMVSLRVSASPQTGNASTNSFKWETHGDSPNIPDHGLPAVPSGQRSGSNKLVLLMLMRVNSGYHFLSGDRTSFKLSIPITETTGTFPLSKVTQLHSLKVVKFPNGCHSTTLNNKIWLSIAFNGIRDSSHKDARTDMLHKDMVSSCMIQTWIKWILSHRWALAMVELLKLKIWQQENTLSEFSISKDQIKAISKSSKWKLSLLMLLLLLFKLKTHTAANEVSRNEIFKKVLTLN